MTRRRPREGQDPKTLDSIMRLAGLEALIRHVAALPNDARVPCPLCASSPLKGYMAPPKEVGGPVVMQCILCVKLLGWLSFTNAEFDKDDRRAPPPRPGFVHQGVCRAAVRFDEKLGRINPRGTRYSLTIWVRDQLANWPYPV